MRVAHRYLNPRSIHVQPGQRHGTGRLIAGRQDVEKEILDEMPTIPYMAQIEKVTVLDC